MVSLAGARLFKLAEDARETGNTGVASLLTEAAARYLEQALLVEAVKALPKSTNDGPPTLQQQQIQQWQICLQHRRPN